MGVLSEWEKIGNSRKSSLLPFWHFSSDQNERTLIAPFSYFSKNDEGDLDLGLLGIAYYRNNDLPDMSETKALLAGTLYWERKKSERGYHSVGSFWGILWDYETESETGFEKFSILKGIYKRVKKNGETKQTFLWFI